MRAQLSWWGALAVGLLAQSTLLPQFLPDPWRPDVTRGLVLWVALTGVPRGGAILAFLAGLALDASTGAPIGFNALLRLGLYALSRPFRGVFFDDRPLLLLPLAIAATLADALCAWLLGRVFLLTPLPLPALASIAWRQALTESAAIPALFLGLEVLSGRRPPRLRRTAS